MSKMWKPQVPLFEQVNSMKHKLQLMDGDRKAYYDATFQKLVKEHKKLTELRAQVKTLRQDLRERSHPDEFITDQALQRHSKERQAMLRFSAPEAIVHMDSQVNDTMKKLNAMQFKTESKKDQLHLLEERYTRLLIFASDQEDVKARQGVIGQHLRSLENRLDKAILKQNEALHVNATYLKIKDLLKQEAVTYNITIEAVEDELVKAKDELKQVNVLYNDAILVRNHDLIELRRHEEFMTTEMKRRELELSNMKKIVHQKNFNTIQSKIVVPMEMSFGDPEDQSNKSEANSILMDENNIRLKRHEDLFQTIKQATGLSSLNQMVKRFQTQVNITSNLTTLRIKLEQDLTDLRHEKESVVNGYLEQKFVNEERGAKQTLIKTEKDEMLGDLTKQYEDSTRNIKLKELLLSQIRFGVEHLAAKCEKKIDRSSDLSDAKIYNKIFEKMGNEVSLYIGEMKDYNIEEEAIKLREEEGEVVLVPSEVNIVIDTRLSTYNNRIKFTNTHQKDLIADEDADPDEKTDVITRESLKKQSKKILEAKVKKRVNVM